MYTLVHVCVDVAYLEISNSSDEENQRAERGGWEESYFSLHALSQSLKCVPSAYNPYSNKCTIKPAINKDVNFSSSLEDFFLLLAFHKKDFLPGPEGQRDLQFWLLLASHVLLSKLFSVAQSLTFIPPEKEINNILKRTMRHK